LYRIKFFMLILPRTSCSNKNASQKRTTVAHALFAGRRQIRMAAAGGSVIKEGFQEKDGVTASIHFRFKLWACH
jgi:hypothetical protein